MDQKTLEQITQWMAFGQIMLPKLVAVAGHYAQLKDDPAIQETDREKMVANLQGMQLADWKDL